MQKRLYAQRYFSTPDLAILLLIATTIYGIVAIGKEWRSDFHPLTQIDLSITALPYYTLMSGFRGIVAYLISLTFTLVIGFTAAKSKFAEKIIVPLLDILQSIPVLGFLPGLLLGLVALFPHTNTGLELAAIIMIFTGQVWNMTFSFYSSLKSLPAELNEASTVIGLSWRQKLTKVELPYSAVNLAWNSLLSMAGGWFFLIPCEAMTLGDKEYRLPGIGAYMDVAIKTGDHTATVLAIAAMIFLIVSIDFVIWRPVLSWVQRFRLEEIAGAGTTEPLMQIWLREAKILRFFKVMYRHWESKRRTKKSRRVPVIQDAVQPILQEAPKKLWVRSHQSGKLLRFLEKGVLIALFAVAGFWAFKLFKVLSHISISIWIRLIRDTLWTFLRVLIALGISTLWAVPVGIWIGISPRRIRIAQPIIQVLASFPAPMLYPLALGLLFKVGLELSYASVFLMLLGVQWYVLFNVLAGAMRIPHQLNDALLLMEASHWDRWKTLYLPSVFPSLVTGWITAAGGAWNASVVAEYIYFQGSIVKTAGLGATLSAATAGGDFTLFAASLTVMVIVVILLNRTFWSKFYHLAQTRFRMEL